jgi:hypothetical protein
VLHLLPHKSQTAALQCRSSRKERAWMFRKRVTQQRARRRKPLMH